MKAVILTILSCFILSSSACEKIPVPPEQEETPKRAEAGLTGWIDCFPKSHLAGTLFCGGVNDPRDIVGNDKLQEAFELGKAL